MIHLALWLFAYAMTVAGIIGISLCFVAALVAAILLGLPVHVRWAIGCAFAVFLTYGGAVQYGEATCRRQQVAAVERVRQADQARIAALQRELTVQAGAYRDALDQADAYRAQLDTRPDKGAGDVLTRGDADEINR